MLLYPAASTLLNIARCHEHQSKLASAWSAYKRVQVLNRETIGEERRRAIDEMVEVQIKELTPRLPKIKLTMARTIPNLTLRKDGEILPAAVVGTEVPVDAGEHEIVAEAPGYRPFRQKLEVKESTLRVIDVNLTLESEPDPHAEVARIPTWTWIAGGAGVAFLGAAAGFRVDQAFVEGRQSGLCKGDVLGGCPPITTYDPASDNTRKNVDFGFFVGFGAASALAFAATVYGVVRASQPAKTTPLASVIVTRDGATMSAAFQF